MGSKTYVKNAIRVVEALIVEDDPEAKLKSTARNPFPSAYKAVLDVTPELNNELGSRFLQLIRILWWAIELGRLDIFVEVLQLSQHQVLPRRGHLEALYHIFAYLKRHDENGARIVFDRKSSCIDERVFNSNADWQDFYGDICKELPPNMPISQCIDVNISCFVDANHAGNAITWQSHTGIIIYVQNAPIIWFSKRQNTVESCSFGKMNLLRSVPRKICLSPCDTSFECLACQLMARSMYCVIITELWRIRRYLNLSLQRSIMQSIIMRSVRRLPRKSYAWVKRTAGPIWQTCSRRCSLPIDVKPYADSSCISFDDITWVINRRMDEVFSPLERTKSAGSNTRLWRTNRWLGLNHSSARTHDLRGPFKYGRYGTETASTVSNWWRWKSRHKFTVSYFRIPFSIQLHCLFHSVKVESAVTYAFSSVCADLRRHERWIFPPCAKDQNGADGASLNSVFGLLLQVIAMALQYLVLYYSTSYSVYR